MGQLINLELFGNIRTRLYNAFSSDLSEDIICHSLHVRAYVYMYGSAYSQSNVRTCVSYQSAYDVCMCFIWRITDHSLRPCRVGGGHLLHPPWQCREPRWLEMCHGEKVSPNRPITSHTKTPCLVSNVGRSTSRNLPSSGVLSRQCMCRCRPNLEIYFLGMYYSCCVHRFSVTGNQLRLLEVCLEWFKVTIDTVLHIVLILLYYGQYVYYASID